MMVRHYWLVDFDTCLTDLTFNQGHRPDGQGKTSVQTILQSFQLISMKFGVVLRLVGLMNCTFLFKGENPTYTIQSVCPPKK